MSIGGLFGNTETRLQNSSDGRFYGCFTCGLYEGAVNPHMEPVGNFEKKIMIISDNPTFKEDKSGVMWNGQSGNILRNELNELGINLEEDCISIYAVSCIAIDKKTEGLRAPNGVEINSCRKRVLNYIKQYKPRMVIALGSTALYSLFGLRWQKGGFEMNKWINWVIPDSDLKTWVLPLFSPVFLLRKEEYEEVGIIWKNALWKGIKYLEKKLPVYGLDKNNVVIIDTEAEIRRFLRLLYKRTIFAWDIETTGLKPHNKALHEILIISFSWSEDKAYSITFPKDKENIDLLKKILSSDRAKKIAHNMKFESMWAAVMLDIEVKNWYWDTMQAAHILNNQPGTSGLKFQTFTRLGIPDYDSDVAPYLKSQDDKNGNGVNKLKELMKMPEGRRKAMLYCGYDSLNTFRLYLLQKEDYEQ